MLNSYATLEKTKTKWVVSVASWQKLQLQEDGNLETFYALKSENLQ